MPDWNINFRFVSNAQTLGGVEKETRSNTGRFARLIVRDVAISARDFEIKQIKSKLNSDFRRAAEGEVAKMAMVISRAIALPQNRRGPEGSMTIKEGFSETARRLGLWGVYNRSDAGIRWVMRGKRYMDTPEKKSSPDWFERTGRLKQTLSDPDLYTDSYGPIRVRFIESRNQEGFGSDARITSSGAVGRSPLTYRVGQVSVEAFGHITPEMMPVLGNQLDNQAVMKKSWTQTGSIKLAGLLDDDYAQAALVDHERTHRPALGPFISFYLTRAIPNAVWRRVERLIGVSRD